MFSYNMFSCLWDEWYSSRFRMNSSIVFLLLFFFVDGSVFLHVIVNVFWNLSVVGNASNLWMRSVFFFKRLGIIECSSFAWPKLRTNNKITDIVTARKFHYENLQLPIFPMLVTSTNECSFRQNR